jgi:hypothetical protein
MDMAQAKIIVILLSCLLYSSFFVSSPVLAEEKPSPAPQIQKKIIKPLTPSLPEGLKPEKDTYVNSAYPNANYGVQEKISTGFTTSSKIIFLKFNLENVKLQEKEKAFLYLWLENSYGELKPIEMEILLPNSDWQEEDLSWNNKPSLYSSGLNVVLEATPGAQKINLTPLLRQWLNGSLENRGLAFYHNLESFSRTFFSRENEKNSPVLVIQKEEEEKPTLLAANFFQISIGQVLEKLPFSLTTGGSKIKGAQIKKKTLDDYLGQKSILPVAGLWTASLLGLLLKAFKEYPLS